MKRNKSKMTKIAIILVIAVFIFSLFKIGTTKASTEVVELTNVEIASKSDTVDVDSVKFEDGKIKNNVTFHKVGDELTYNVTIANKDEKNYVLKTISDNNENESLTYSYSGYEGAKLEANKAATFKVTITYAKEVEDITQREQSNSVAVTLTFEDEAGNEKEEDVVIEPEDNTPTDDTTDSSEEKTTPVENNSANPKTGDNIAVYITTAVASFILLIILTRKQMVMNRKSSKRNNHGKYGKHGMKMLGLILAIVLVVPAFSNISKAATTSSLSTTIDTSIKFMDKIVVSYKVDGETKEQVIPYNGTIENLEDPTKEGFEFTGWKLEDGTDVTEEIKVTSDTVLVPQFIELEKTSEITINVKDEDIIESEKEVTISAVNKNISNNRVQLQYSLDDGETWTNYDGAITVTETVTLKARTVIKGNEQVLGTAEKEIIIDENIDKLRAYFVGKTSAEIFDPSTYEFIDNEVLTDASSIEILSNYGKVIKYKDNLYILRGELLNRETMKFTSVNAVVSDADKIAAYVALDGFQSADFQNGYYRKDANGMIETDMKIIYFDVDFSTYCENIVVEYKDKTYEISIGMMDGIINVSEVDNFNPTDVERLRSYFIVNAAGMGGEIGANYDAENNEFTKDTIGIVDSNIKVLTSIDENPILIEYKDKNYVVEIDSYSHSVSVTEEENYFNCTINIDGAPVMGNETLNIGEEKVLTVTDCDEDVTFASSDENVLTIDNNGNLRALDAGTATITVTGVDTGKTKTITIVVPKSFTIVFNKNAEDATGTMANQTMTYGVSANLTSNSFARPGYEFTGYEFTGYDFSGWNTEADGSGTMYTDQQSVKNLAEENGAIVNLYAQWGEVKVYGQKVNYSVDVNGITLDNWKLFMTDDDGYAYVIYGDYLPNAAIPQAAIDEGHLSKDGNYKVWSTTNRTDLINSMTNSSNWSSFVSSSLQTAAANAGGTATVTGGATATQFKKSWNDQYLSGQVTVTGNETSGWSSQRLSGTTGYNVAESNNMYFPHKSEVSDGSNAVYGYWLASPNAYGTDIVMLVNYGGDWANHGSRSPYGAFRPLVRLPSSILQLNDDGVSWDIAE